MLPIDGDFIMRVAPHYSGAAGRAQAAIVQAISPALVATLSAYDVTTRLRIAHFIGQLAHESAGFRTTEEFASGAAYEGRADLGNVSPGDGRRFKGRGLIQLTGRANYRAVGAELGLPLEERPEQAADPVVSLQVAGAFWRRRAINAAADRDDLVAVTRLVNGGLNGLAERGEYVRRAKTALATLEGIVVGAAQGGTAAVLRRGSRDEAVGALQTQLRGRGFRVAVDNDFGPATELAVETFQSAARLDVDGIVGRRTWAALRTEPSAGAR